MNLKNNWIISRILRGLGYVAQGRIWWRIQLEVKERLRRRRMAMWKRHSGKSGSRDFRVQPKLGIRLWFDSHLSGLIYNGDFELEERQFLNRFLNAGDIFVDVGANIGLFTLIASPKVGPKGKVYTFEPCAGTYNRMLTNLQLNRLTNVFPHRVALSDEAKTLEMSVSTDGFDAWNTLGRVTHGKTVSTETIQSITYDQFAEENDIVGRVALMKIDVEGWETHVLIGAQKTLSRPDAPTLLVEFTDEVSDSAGSSCQDLYRMLQQLDYQMFVYDSEANTLIPDALRNEYPYLNLVATKEADKVADRLKGNGSPSKSRRHQ